MQVDRTVSAGTVSRGEKMVCWYSPGMLLRTGCRVAVATAFARYSDFRRLESLLTPPRKKEAAQGGAAASKRKDGDFSDCAKDHEFWFDYVADTGDGWDSTYAVAYHVSRCCLDLAGPKGTNYETQRGEILIFGGDQVYPDPSRLAYQQRTIAPYEAALVAGPEPKPALYAIPGNHDWYDGLVAFTRLFCQERRFAAWETKQSLSYFALKLPRGWWLLGVDIQLDVDLDDAQIQFFRSVESKMRPEDKVILCVAEPHWIKRERYGEKHYTSRLDRLLSMGGPGDPRFNENNLVFLEDKILDRKVSVFLAGDLHHYRRHATADDTRQKITAGGGGAFLHPTHNQNVKTLHGAVKYTEQCCFPDEATSRRLCRRNLLFPFLNPGFGLLPAIFYLMITWPAMVELSHDQPWALDRFVSAACMQLAITATAACQPVWGTIFSATLSTLLPGSWFAVLLAAMMGFVLMTDTRSPRYRWFAGSTHAIVHFLAAIAIAWSAAYFTTYHWGMSSGLWQWVVSGFLILVGGWIVGS